MYLDGKLNGEKKSYYENGQLEILCSYTDGKKNGESKTFDPNGQLLYICSYIDDELKDVRQN